MNNKELAQFHSTAETLAGELSFRSVLRDAGFNERDIDKLILRAYLRKRLLGTWLPIAAIAALLLGTYSQNVVVLVLLVVLFAAGAWGWVSYLSLLQCEHPEQWTRKRGTTWTGEWQRL